MYAYSGLGALDCYTKAQKKDAASACAVFRTREFCDIAKKPTCGTATFVEEAYPPPPPPLPPPPPPVQTGPHAAAMTHGPTASAYAKLPVKAAAPEVTMPAAPLPPEPGVPTWVWIAGAATVLGGAAFLFSRRKAA